ncbi:MAG: riboflavin synthase [Rhodovibrionaceae bacterium]|nr:riboflavin synthase [Rhodovibrionaceae bacterium]
MFTGLVSDLGRVRKVVEGDGDRRFVLETGYDLDEVAEGASIACSGCCLTVVAKGADWFAVDVSAETLSRTTLGGWREGTAVNLERSLRLGEDLGGHLVSGHVDGVARILDRRRDGGSLRFAIESPPELCKFIASKGSIAIDGVSLTVNEVDGASFGVNIIPHTAEVTTFGERQAGDPVNLEIDMLARYVQRLLEKGE